jgi:uncharacterized membrane protein YkvA (DUF1232 family)
VTEGSTGSDLSGALGDAAIEGPSTGLLSFYDRLRVRIERGVSRRGGKLGPKLAEALLLVPDVFVLLLRLSLDPQVPKATRALIGGALAYFVLPMDLFPEGVVGIAGYSEDLVLACAVLARAFGDDLEPYAARYWNGSKRLSTVLKDISQAAESLLGAKLSRRVDGLLGRLSSKSSPQT